MQVLEEHDLSCLDLLHVKSDGVVLTKQSMSRPNFYSYLYWNFVHTIPADDFFYPSMKIMEG
jgi:hypothetical protein